LHVNECQSITQNQAGGFLPSSATRRAGLYVTIEVIKAYRPNARVIARYCARSELNELKKHMKNI